METKITTVFPEFSSMTEGKTFMTSYSTPVGFFSKNKYYTAAGVITDVTEIYHEIAPKEILNAVYPEGNEDTLEGELYVNEGYLKYNKEVETIEE